MYGLNYEIKAYRHCRMQAADNDMYSGRTSQGGRGCTSGVHFECRGYTFVKLFGKHVCVRNCSHRVYLTYVQILAYCHPAFCDCGTVMFFMEDALPTLRCDRGCACSTRPGQPREFRAETDDGILHHAGTRRMEDRIVRALASMRCAPIARARQRDSYSTPICRHP